MEQPRRFKSLILLCILLGTNWARPGSESNPWAMLIGGLYCGYLLTRAGIIVHELHCALREARSNAKVETESTETSFPEIGHISDQCSPSSNKLTTTPTLSLRENHGENNHAVEAAETEIGSIADQSSPNVPSSPTDHESARLYVLQSEVDLLRRLRAQDQLRIESLRERTNTLSDTLIGFRTAVDSIQNELNLLRPNRVESQTPTIPDDLTDSSSTIDLSSLELGELDKSLVEETEFELKNYDENP